MITVSQAERLVRKITEVMTQSAADAHTAKLAEDYADLCRACNRRLEQCALMIEAGQSLQALQLAETHPPLLDVITVLNFRQAAPWRSYCQTHQLAVGEPFYDKFIRLLNSAYGSGIASDHPFYRDYRRAVLTNDNTKAFSILRVIARMNPSDENTAVELKRVEENILRVKMEKLREAVEAKNGAAIREVLTQIEASGAKVPASHPVWQQAQIARCEEMLRRAEEFRQQDAWQDAEVLVDEIHALATQYRLQLPANDAEAWKSLEVWASEHRRAYANEQDFQRAVSTLGYELQTVESEIAKGVRVSAEEANRQLTSLAAKWSNAGRLGHALDADLSIRRQQCEHWLQDQLHAAARKRRIIRGAVLLTVVVVLAALFPFARGWFMEREYVHRIAALTSCRQVSGLAEAAAHAPPGLVEKAAIQAALQKARDSIAHEKELKQHFDITLNLLEQLSATGFRGPLDQLSARRAESDRAMSVLAPEFQPAAKHQILAWDDQWRFFRNAAMAAQIQNAENIAVDLTGANGFDSVKARLPVLQSVMAAIAQIKIEPPSLDENLEMRYRALTNKLVLWTGHVAHWEAVQTALTRAQTVEDYLDRLDQSMLSPFATAAQQEAAAQIDRLKINREMLLGELLLPNDRPAWDSLTNATGWRTALMPEQPTAQEKDVYFRLRDDKNMRNVYLYQLVTNARPNNPFHTHPVFVQGLITLDRGGQMAGEVYDPEEFHDTSKFLPVAYSDWDFGSIVKSNRAPESESFERLGLGDLIDPNTGNYQKPILQFFDQLNRDDNSSAIFRALVTLRFFNLTRLRPEEWGLQWCPAATRHLQALKDLGALDLKSGDWMVTIPTQKYEAALRKYFERIRLIPFEKQAVFLQQLTQQACQTDFSYAGFINSAGQAVLLHATGPVLEYWGWSPAAPSAVKVLRKAPGAAEFEKTAEPLPFTPLFIFNGDRRQLFYDTARSVSYPEDQMAGILPPFFSDLHE